MACEKRWKVQGEGEGEGEGAGEGGGCAGMVGQ